MTAAILQDADTVQCITLQDGRQLSYSICGDRSGHKVMFLHPIQGNRYMALTFHKVALELKLCIIAPERPGIGHSSPLPGRTVQQYPADVAELCQQLNIQQFSIMAMSAGTMYAMALTIAEETKGMVVGPVTVVAPYVPPSSRQPGTWSLLTLAASWAPVSLLQAFLGFSNGRIAHQAEFKPVTELMTRSNAQEKAAFAADPDNDSIYKAMIKQWNSSLPGIIQEMQLCMERSQKLHFHYADIPTPVRVYMGTADKVLQYSIAEYWASQCPSVELIAVQDGTHDGVIPTHKVVALEALACDLGILEKPLQPEQQQHHQQEQPHHHEQQQLHSSVPDIDAFTQDVL